MKEMLRRVRKFLKRMLLRDSALCLNKDLPFQQVGVDKNDIPDISYVSYLYDYILCVHLSFISCSTRVGIY